MKRVVLATEYVLNLTDDESGLVLDDWTLGERLDKLPIRDIDYDGHFGAAVYYTVNREDDTEEVHKQVIAVCRQRLIEIGDAKLKKELRGEKGGKA